MGKETLFDPNTLTPDQQELFFGRSLVEKIKKPNSQTTLFNLDILVNKEGKVEMLEKLRKKKHPPKFLAGVLIRHNSPKKKYWSFFINLIIIYSSITSTYFLSFEKPTSLM